MPEPLSHLIADVPVDRGEQARDLESIRPAEHHYAILFIARSGSTWLADLLSRQGDLGKPREYFNPTMIARFAEEMGSNTLGDYLALLRRKRATPNGVFGLKMSLPQLDLLSGDARIETLFAGWSWIYLRRRNAVAQAVSLYKARASGAYQRRRNDAAELRRRLDEADARVPYDAGAIEERLQEIVASESAAERFFESCRMAPLRLLYEDMMATDPSAIVATVRKLVLGAAVPPAPAQPSNIAPSGNEQNLDFEARFRRERAELVSRLGRERPS
jgi:LPS sulfotransferase NodH